ncbi:MAG TPA: DUF5317 family protein [Candidatus Limnocylindrales bacterium]|nr:DUF5317 family protein [Candidatus Limnocylindrales bacterium]
MLLLYFLAAALVLGLLTGGRLERLATVHLRWAPLALAGLVVQALLFSPLVATRVGAAGIPLYVASTLAVGVALLVNARQRGLAVLALGALLNLIVILVNGGLMPTTAEAFAVAYGAGATPTDGGFSNSFIGGPETPLLFLGDVFVLPPPIPLANVFSIGDVLIGLGGGLFLFDALRRPREAAAVSSSRAPEAAGRG